MPKSLQSYYLKHSELDKGKKKNRAKAVALTRRVNPTLEGGGRLQLHFCNTFHIINGDLQLVNKHALSTNQTITRVQVGIIQYSRQPAYTSISLSVLFTSENRRSQRVKQLSGNTEMAGTATGSLWLLIQVGIFLGVMSAKDECQVYYGGLVFPEGSHRSLEHGMHWSKTRSEWKNVLVSLPPFPQSCIWATPTYMVSLAYYIFWQSQFLFVILLH